MNSLILNSAYLILIIPFLILFSCSDNSPIPDDTINSDNLFSNIEDIQIYTDTKGLYDTIIEDKTELKDSEHIGELESNDLVDNIILDIEADSLDIKDIIDSSNEDIEFADTISFTDVSINLCP